MEPIKSFKELTAYLTSGQNAKRKKMAVANAVDDHTIEAVMHAVSQGVIEAYLVGDEKIISEKLKAFEPTEFVHIVNVPDIQAATEEAVRMVKAG